MAIFDPTVLTDDQLRGELDRATVEVDRQMERLEALLAEGERRGLGGPGLVLTDAARAWIAAGEGAGATAGSRVQ